MIQDFLIRLISSIFTLIQIIYSKMDLTEKLKIEIDELSERMDKLDIFIRSENFPKVSSAQQNLLIIQHSTMEAYLK